jgi:hypothetical protein
MIGGDKMEELQDMLGTLLEIENEIEALEFNKKIVKSNIQKIVEGLPDQRCEIAGMGTVLMTKPSPTASYEAKQLDALTAQLLQNGEIRTAQAIADCRKESLRASHLMFRKQKG